MNKTDGTEIREEVEKGNGEIVLKRVVLQQLEYEVDIAMLADALALRAARANDVDCKGFTLSREVLGDTVKVRFGNVHPDHAARFEVEITKHEKKQTGQVASK